MALFENIPKIKAKKKDSKALGALAYLPFGQLIIPILIYILTKNDKYVRFHALNAIGFQLLMMVVGVIVFIVYFISIFASVILAAVTGGLGILILPIIWIFIMGVIFGSFALSIYFMYLAYKGKAFNIPIVTIRVLDHI